MMASNPIKHVIRRALPKSVRRRLRPPGPPWVLTEPAPPDVCPIEFTFYAIVGTWMEEDIIADTVANCFAQGVDRVFLLDNDSPDGTVEAAVAAGADHVMTYRTDTFEERYRYNLMNEFVRHMSEAGTSDHVWWLWLDADEFARPEKVGTLRDMLERLDQRYRIVGARVINHYPTPGAIAHVPGQHPVNQQPMCEEVPDPMCDRFHRKHPLQRWDRDGPMIQSGLGFHNAISDQRPLLEPVECAVIHHVPYRNETFTRRRMNELWSGSERHASRARSGDMSTDHMEARLRSLDAVYAGEWPKVHNYMPGAAEHGIQLRHWHDLTPRICPDLPTWDDRAKDARV